MLACGHERTRPAARRSPRRCPHTDAGVRPSVTRGNGDVAARSRRGGVSSLPAFFIADGDRFVPSASARGPWSPRHQHGGPPAALLARAFARQTGPQTHIARLTFDFLRPVPLAPVTITTRVVRAGAKVQRLAGSVLAEDGAAVIEATCLIMRVAPGSVAVTLETLAAPVPPAASAPFELPLHDGRRGVSPRDGVAAGEGNVGRWAGGDVAPAARSARRRRDAHAAARVPRHRRGLRERRGRRRGPGTGDVRERRPDDRPAPGAGR